MGCIGTSSPLTILNESVDLKDMAEGVSRRSTRSFVAEQEGLERGGARVIVSESQSVSSLDDFMNERYQRELSLQTASSTDSLAGYSATSLGSDTSEVIGLTGGIAFRTPAIAKEDGRPLNFGTVRPGQVYRSSFPQPEDYQYLSTLGLKTIITLRKQGTFEDHYVGFMKSNRIHHRVFEMHGTKKVKISVAMMTAIMKIALDERSHPLLIHCNHGIHRTGCTVAIMRLAHGSDIESTIAEYCHFAGQKVRNCDLSYINTFDITSVQGLVVAAASTRTAISNSLSVSALWQTRRMCCFTALAILSCCGVWWFLMR